MKVTVSFLFGFGAILGILACILFVVFGQVTVRKLRKNPKLKGDLGFEFVSGWDIVNVAHSLFIPLSLSDKLHKGPLAFLEANARTIREHTTKLDLFLARAFCFFLYTSQIILLPLAILDGLGVLE